MSEHECKCRECKPEAFPVCDPATPGFVGVKSHHPSMYPSWVKVNGDIVPMVVDAISGEKGWVVYFPPNPDVSKGAHPCKCRQAACTDVRYGYVEFGPPKADSE